MVSTKQNKLNTSNVYKMFIIVWFVSSKYKYYIKKRKTSKDIRHIKYLIEI